MLNQGEKSVRTIIENILAEREDDFSWACSTPAFYDEYDDEEESLETFQTSNPTFETLSSIRNLCDSIHNSISNSETQNESFLQMELMDIENKLREINDNLNTLQNYTNNQPQILTGDILLA